MNSRPILWWHGAWIKKIANPAKRYLDLKIRVKLLAKMPVGSPGIARQLRFAAVRHQPLTCHEAGHDAYGECAAAEPEAEDAVSIVVVAAKKAIEGDDVAFQSEAKDTAQDGERFERGGTDAVVVERNLRCRIAEIERLIEPPDVRFAGRPPAGPRAGDPGRMWNERDPNRLGRSRWIG